MKTRTLLCSLFTASALFTIPTMSVLAEGGSAHHSGQASKHSALAVSHGGASTAKVASAVVATPIIIAGSASVAAGSSVLALGDSIATSGNRVSVHKHNTPIHITDIVITADPAPNKAMAQQQNDQTTVVTTISETIEVMNTTTVKQVKQ